jgi:transcriptional regulator with XRE-family HTH domain
MNIPWFIKARERVDALGMQRTQFAERMGVSKGLVTQWFQGATTPPFKRFTKMAEVLDMTVAELIADDESFAKNPTELATLRMVRDLPADQQAAALALMATLFRGLKASSAYPLPPTTPPNNLTKTTP